MTRIRWQDRIAVTPDIHHGDPCIKGTRIPVTMIIGTLALEPIQAFCCCDPTKTASAPYSGTSRECPERAQHRRVERVYHGCYASRDSHPPRLIYQKMPAETAYSEVEHLGTRFKGLSAAARRVYNEDSTRKDFIMPLFRALESDTQDSTEVSAEEKASRGWIVRSTGWCTSCMD